VLAASLLASPWAWRLCLQVTPACTAPSCLQTPQGFALLMAKTSLVMSQLKRCNFSFAVSGIFPFLGYAGLGCHQLLCIRKAGSVWAEICCAAAVGPWLMVGFFRGPCVYLRRGRMLQTTYPSPYLQIPRFSRLLGFSAWEWWRSLSFSLTYRVLFHSHSSSVIFPLLFFVSVSWCSWEEIPWGFQLITVFFYPKKVKSSSANFTRGRQIFPMQAI